MGNLPTTGLQAEIRELLTAIRDALDLPYAATAAGDEKRERLRGENAVRVVSSIDYLLNFKHATVANVARTLRSLVDEHPADYTTREETSPTRREFTVTARPWEHGWELHVQGVGVTQSKASPTDAELMARDFIATELDVLSDSFEIALDLREVAQ